MHSLNRQVALRLEEAADILESQGANLFRVGAYRRAAATVAALKDDIGRRVERGGLNALLELPHVGKGIASAIHEMVRTGRWSQLERMRGTLDPVDLFRTVPGIGPELAARIHSELHIDTLEALEIAAFDGRLAEVHGIGARRLHTIQAALASMLGRRRLRAVNHAHRGPEVDLLLEVDREYRRRAAAKALPQIAPKRFNPEAKAWLPVMHLERGGWQFTALFSNTALAHRLERTADWVVIYYYDRDHQEGQHTVVTETQGQLAGRRVVRGREEECRAYYRSATRDKIA